MFQAPLVVIFKRKSTEGNPPAQRSPGGASTPPRRFLLPRLGGEARLEVAEQSRKEQGDFWDIGDQRQGRDHYANEREKRTDHFRNWHLPNTARHEEHHADWMMQGLVLDRTAPLYGRATEILKIEPLPCGWVWKALRTTGDRDAIEAVAVWGGIPRYWELAADYPDREAAIQGLVLSQLGVLYDEPTRLLRDDLRDLAQAASILTLIGQGCHRPSEIASRLGMPATSLSRPLERLLELGLVRRDQPFGASPRDSKRSLYRIGDPFLRFWFRFPAPPG